MSDQNPAPATATDAPSSIGNATPPPKLPEPTAKLNWSDNTFDVQVKVYQLDTEGNFATKNGEFIILKDVGAFRFKNPTLWDIQDAGVREAGFLRGTLFSDETTIWLARVRSILPQVTLMAPDGWDWEKLTQDRMDAVAAVWREYTAGLQKFRDGK